MTDYQAVARQAALQAGIDPNVFIRQIRQESGFNPSARSHAGAQGIAQIMPATAKGWGVNPNDPVAALHAAAKAMAKYVHSYGSYRNALVAYNAGPGAVGKALPKETQDYIAKILGGVDPSPATTAQAAPQGVAAAPAVNPIDTRIAALQAARNGLGLHKPSADPSLVNPTIDLHARTSSLRDQLQGINDRRAAAAQATDVATPTTGPNPVAPAPDGNQTYKEILGLGSQFGLHIDGSNQTTGGGHASGSYHYQGRAVDFGDAKNSPDQLREFAAWARANHGRIKELFYNPLGWGIKNGKIIKGLTVAGHDDHLHIAM